MASSIKPFAATFFNRRFAGEYSKLACPPYDVISREDLAQLKKKSPYNFSHILIAENNAYEKVAKKFNQWLEKEILVDDNTDGFYLYEQTFKVNKKTYRRFGILSLLKMDKKDIFPHEYTLAKPKEDRKKMINAVKANLSPIFVIASGRNTTLQRIYQQYRRKNPFLSFKDKEGNFNSVWAIKDRNQTKAIVRAFDKSKLTIADGHHRFEISYDYFLKNKDRFKDLNYVLAYITDCQKGLLVLPTHRLVNIADDKKTFFTKLAPYFNIRPVSRAYLEKKLNQAKKFCFGIYRSKKAYFLEPKNLKIFDRLENKNLKELDAYVFQQLVLPLFTISGDIEYSHDFNQACKNASTKKTVFFLRAASLESIINISSKGLRFPQKSTYFYPKVSSGIVLRRFKN